MISRELQALQRSLRCYHGDKARHAAMDALYRRFLKPGDLVFDIGAHVGDRTSSFRRLGCRVVALEPQPLPARALRLIHGGDPLVTLLQVAAGPGKGTLTLHVNSRNPTVSTVSPDFVAAAHGAGGWEGQVWDRTLEVPSTTLDNLIERFGKPAFLKIDVEGFEAEVLAGLSQEVPALSFEFTTIQRDAAFRCLCRLAALAPYRFNVALGETQRLTFEKAIVARAMANYIATLAPEANSGDVYALLSR
jgi:FkbM family methyltransferase